MDPQGQPAGMNIEMAQAVAKKLGTKLDIVTIPFKAQIPALVSERADIGWAGYTILPERLKQVERLESGGRAARYDVLRARVQHTNLEPEVIQAQSDRELTMLQVKRILNLPVNHPPPRTAAPFCTVNPPSVSGGPTRRFGRSSV